MIRKIVSFIFVLSFFIALTTGLKAQTDEPEISLLDFEEVTTHLLLNETQVEEIIPLIEEIRKLVEENEEMRMKMQEFRDRGERPDRDFMMKMREEREARSQKVESLIEEIKENLTEDQIKKFDDIELPDFTMQRRGRGGF